MKEQIKQRNTEVKGGSENMETNLMKHIVKGLKKHPIRATVKAVATGGLIGLVIHGGFQESGRVQTEWNELTQRASAVYTVPYNGRDKSFAYFDENGDNYPETLVG